MLVSSVLPVEQAHRLYPCDIDGRPVPCGGGTVFLNPNLWCIEYGGGRLVAVAECLPIIEILHYSSSIMVIRSLTSYNWQRGIVETNLGQIQGYVVPALVIPPGYTVISIVVDLDSAPPRQIITLGL